MSKAIEVTTEQKIVWNALLNRIKYFEKRKTRKNCPTMETFIEKEKRRKKHGKRSKKSSL